MFSLGARPCAEQCRRWSTTAFVGAGRHVREGQLAGEGFGAERTLDIAGLSPGRQVRRLLKRNRQPRRGLQHRQGREVLGIRLVKALQKMSDDGVDRLAGGGRRRRRRDRYQARREMADGNGPAQAEPAQQREGTTAVRAVGKPIGIEPPIAVVSKEDQSLRRPLVGLGRPHEPAAARPHQGRAAQGGQAAFAEFRLMADDLQHQILVGSHLRLCGEDGLQMVVEVRLEGQDLHAQHLAHEAVGARRQAIRVDEPKMTDRVGKAARPQRPRR
ncbi:MAG: hypothetical protein FD129_19 [bacterium]|nr:MAG: hypothetical protein FD129_19 [bacterium]